MPVLYTAAQCRELDRLAIQEQGIAGFELMKRAGRAAFDALLQRWPGAASLTVCCGKGNNAGDGYIVAGFARALGLPVQLLQAGDAALLGGDAARARDWALKRGVTIEPWNDAQRLEGDVIVDALLGTGLKGAVREPFAGLVSAMNASPRPVLALDLPSGVIADSGAVAGPAVAADLTVAFIGRKIGLYTGPGIALAGEVRFADLGVPGAIFARVPGVPLLRVDALGAAGLGLPRRDANAYKQALGHVLVVGGDYSMGGAVAMAAEAALRVGAGLVSVLTRAAHRPAILARRPELMVVDADDAAARQSVFGKASTLVVGPGLGRDPWGHALLREALDLGLPTLLDADGLNGLARLDLRPTQALVITPHAGEAAHLLGVTPGEIQQDRLGSALRLADRVNGVAVLKGAGTIVASAGEVLGVCGHGNPGMASAGMGDVLSGIIGGLIAQLPTPAAAAIVGTCLHSAAADLAAQQLGQPSLLATDLLPHLIELLRQAPERG